MKKDTILNADGNSGLDNAKVKKGRRFTNPEGIPGKGSKSERLRKEIAVWTNSKEGDNTTPNLNEFVSL